MQVLDLDDQLKNTDLPLQDLANVDKSKDCKSIAQV